MLGAKLSHSEISTRIPRSQRDYRHIPSITFALAVVRENFGLRRSEIHRNATKEPMIVTIMIVKAVLPSW